LFHLPENEVLGDPCWFGFMLTIKSPDLINRTKFQTYLENAGIQTRLLFAGNIVRQPCFDFLQLGKDYKVVGVLPSTDWVTDNGLWVGVYPGLKPEDIEYMGTTIKRFVRDRVR
jgi:CDP-6-deoxy-D-xylo-4-hexulose-3-dehydrase